MTSRHGQTDCKAKSSNELEDLFIAYWKGSVRTFQIDSVEWSPSNPDHEMDFREKLSCAPKLLGFVHPIPKQNLTEAGIALASALDIGKGVEEIWTRQLMKYQIPSPFENFSEVSAKPFLEVLRFVKENGSVSVNDLESFLAKFLKTQASNMRDYADACFRYLRATGLVNVSHVGKSLSIVPERVADVDYILATVDREPFMAKTEEDYIAYLGNARTPVLLTDNKAEVIKRLQAEFPTVSLDSTADVEELKELLADLTEQRKADTLKKQVAEIKDYKLYDDIQQTFEQIKKNELYDAPLMLEWNTWRAMTMLDGGEINANLHFDDFGKPLSTAQGNLADIVCDYGDYLLSVEVTMASGQKQYEMESEPVSRHLGKLKKATGKPCYSLFVAPTINDACVAHFFALHSMNISYYGGKSVIVPLPLEIFQKMLEDSYKASNTPNPQQVEGFFKYSVELVKSCADEKDWFDKITAEAASWLH